MIVIINFVYMILILTFIEYIRAKLYRIASRFVVLSIGNLYNNALHFFNLIISGTWFRFGTIQYYFGTDLVSIWHR